MNNRKKSKSRRKQFKRKNSKNLKIKRKSKIRKKIMSGGGNMRAKIKNYDSNYNSVFVYKMPSNPESTGLKKYTNGGDPPTDYMLPNDTVVDVIDKSDWGENYNLLVAEKFRPSISTPGLKGQNYQIIKFFYKPSGVNPLYLHQTKSYGLVGSDHLDYNIPPEPEPAAAPSENKEEKCELIKQLCMNSKYDEAITEINKLRSE